MLKTGAAKEDITCLIDGVGMLGYGKAGNVVRGLLSPQYARSFVWQHRETVLAYSVIDICFVTDALKHAVLTNLQAQLPDVFHYETVMLTAQHTHSGAGGFGQHFFYNLPFDGFQEGVLTIYATGITKSIVEAYQNRTESEAVFSVGAFDDAAEIGINRSLHAYNQNADIREKRKPDEAAFAIDRTLSLLQFYTKNNTPIGSINWFGVHTTSLSNDNTLVSADNKGFAAHHAEAYFQTQQAGIEPPSKPIVCAFAQSTAGDVTPNFIYDSKKRWMRGKFENDAESAKFNGILQADLALSIYEKQQVAHQKIDKTLTKLTNESPQPVLDFIAYYLDWSKMEASAEFTPHGETGKRTAPSCLGIAFLEGTAEGPGAPRLLGTMTRYLTTFLKHYETRFLYRFSGKNRHELEAAAFAKYDAHDPKSIVLEMQNRRLLLAAPRKVALPRSADLHVRRMKEIDELGLAAQQNWLPHRFQIQLFILNDLAIVGMPCEVTTVAGERLRNTVAPILAARGVKHIVIQAYANGYAGYLTTYEEYLVQAYEGGHTPFGKWSLAACQTQVQAMATQLLLPKNERNTENTIALPTLLPDELVWKPKNK